ncbi:MAG: hypothetical protein KDA87_13235 [Planctomycetales bacterium]|nr:hypothetical protein [Planctomycetales bacterium]
MNRLIRWVLLFGLALEVGCSQPAQIERYQVESEQRVVSAEMPASVSPNSSAVASPQKMLASLTVKDRAAWFFKLQGEPTEVSNLADDFSVILDSVTFDGDQPNWTLPGGWENRPGGGFRFATLAKDGQEISVSSLPVPDRDLNEYVLENVNRWLGQLQLPPWSAEDLEKNAQKRSVGGFETWLIDIEGQGSGNAMAGMTANPPLKTSPPSPAGNQELPIKFDVPEGWQQVAPTTMSVANLQVQADGQEVVLTITPLGGDGGGRLPNVNRWRGQLQLPPMSEAELSESVQSVDLGSGTADVVFLENPDVGKATYAALIFQSNRSWFIKFAGDLELANQHQAAFMEFVQSISFVE